MNIKKYLDSFLEGEWKIGFIDNDLKEILDGKTLSTWWVKSKYKEGWFADPFILDVTQNDIILLCEEYHYRIKRGRISKLVVNRHSHELISVKPILTLDTHLSFPAIIRKGNDVFIYPENYQGGGLNLYRYDTRADTCSLEKNISDKLLTDAVITDLFGERFCFSTNEPTPNGSTLTIYKVGNDTLTYMCNAVFPSKIARNAGDFFEYNKSIYRPAQDCNDGYGAGIVLQRVFMLSENQFEFNTVRKLYFADGKFNRGCHTFNTYKGVTVIDVHGYRHPVKAKIRECVTKINALLK